MGVYINGGTPIMRVYKKIHENPIKMDDFGVPPLLETPKIGAVALEVHLDQAMRLSCRRAFGCYVNEEEKRRTKPNRNET